MKNLKFFLLIAAYFTTATTCAAEVTPSSAANSYSQNLGANPSEEEINTLVEAYFPSIFATVKNSGLLFQKKGLPEPTESNIRAYIRDVVSRYPNIDPKEIKPSEGRVDIYTSQHLNDRSGTMLTAIDGDAYFVRQKANRENKQYKEKYNRPIVVGVAMPDDYTINNLSWFMEAPTNDGSGKTLKIKFHTVNDPNAKKLGLKSYAGKSDGSLTEVDVDLYQYFVPGKPENLQFLKPTSFPENRFIAHIDGDFVIDYNSTDKNEKMLFNKPIPVGASTPEDFLLDPNKWYYYQLDDNGLEVNRKFFFYDINNVPEDKKNNILSDDEINTTLDKLNFFLNKQKNKEEFTTEEAEEFNNIKKIWNGHLGTALAAAPLDPNYTLYPKWTTNNEKAQLYYYTFPNPDAAFDRANNPEEAANIEAADENNKILSATRSVNMFSHAISFGEENEEITLEITSTDPDMTPAAFEEMKRLSLLIFATDARLASHMFSKMVDSKGNRQIVPVMITLKGKDYTGGVSPSSDMSPERLKNAARLLRIDAQKMNQDAIRAARDARRKAADEDNDDFADGGLDRLFDGYYDDKNNVADATKKLSAKHVEDNALKHAFENGKAVTVEQIGAEKKVTEAVIHQIAVLDNSAFTEFLEGLMKARNETIQKEEVAQKHLRDSLTSLSPEELQQVIEKVNAIRQKDGKSIITVDQADKLEQTREALREMEPAKFSELLGKVFEERAKDEAVAPTTNNSINATQDSVAAAA